MQVTTGGRVLQDNGACLARADGLGALEHEPESLGASDLPPVRPDVEVSGIERSRASARGLAGESRNAYGATGNSMISAHDGSFVSKKEGRGRSGWGGRGDYRYAS